MPIISGSTVIRGSRGTPVAQDADDKLITVIQGSQGNAVAQDVNDRLIAMMYGSAGTPVAQDAANKLISVMQGSQGTDVAQDAANKLITVIQGSQGAAVAQLVTGELIAQLVGSTGNPIAQDANDKIIAVMQGDNGVAIAQDAANRLEAILYGDTGVVAQDAGNNLIAVMKGDYLGALKTWKVDVEGRGEMFLNDTEDIWGNINTVGLAEVAVRMGSVDSFDRRGTVFYYDDFEDAPLKWNRNFETGAGGTGHSITLSNERTFRGSGCMKIIPPNVATDYSRAFRYIGGVSAHKVGMETNVTFADTLNLMPCVLFRAYTGTRNIWAGIRIEQQGAGGLSYLNNTGNQPHLDAAWTTFDNTFNLDLYTSYPIKFVVDLDTEKYIRCMFGGTEIDMSALTPYATNSTFCQRVLMDIYVVAGTAGAVLFDDFIFTIEEPA